MQRRGEACRDSPFNAAAVVHGHSDAAPTPTPTPIPAAPQTPTPTYEQYHATATQLAQYAQQMHAQGYPPHMVQQYTQQAQYVTLLPSRWCLLHARSVYHGLCITTAFYLGFILFD